MIFGYFDESGTDTAHQVAISGFIAKLEEWGDALAEWNKELDRVGVRPFHRVECKGRSWKGPYRGWTEEQSREHIERLARIVGRSQLYPVSCAFTGDWSKVQLTPAERLWCPSAYHECFEAVMIGCMERTLDSYGPEQNIAVIMERQDQFSTWAQSMYDVRKYNGAWSNIVHFSYGDKATVPYLQFADLFVWEVRRRMWQLAHNKPIRGDEYATMWHIGERPDFNEKLDLGVYRTDKEVREYRDIAMNEIRLGVSPMHEFPPGFTVDGRPVRASIDD
jgi:hypothetical protein